MGRNKKAKRVRFTPYTGKVTVEPKVGPNMVKGPQLTRRFTLPKIRVMASVAIKAGSRAHIETLGEKLLTIDLEPKRLYALGELVAASAVIEGMKMPVAKVMRGCFLDSIARTPVELEVSSSGRVTTRAGRGVSPRGRMGCPGGGEGDDDDFTVEVGNCISVTRKEGVTIYHFDNLHIHIDAKKVETMIVNPQQVINQLTDRVTDIDAAVQKKVNDEDNDNKKKKK